MANRFWVPGGGGVWNNTDTTNWSLTSGGASGQTPPGTGDVANFDGNSGTANVTTSGAISVATLIMVSNYTGTITPGTTTPFSVLGLFEMHGGTFDASVNNPAVQVGGFESSATTNARTLKMGSGAWTIGNQGWSTISTGLAITLTTSSVTFNLTSQITTGGVSMPPIIINGTGITVTLEDTYTCAGILTLTAGTLNTNSQTCSWGTFVGTGTTARTLTMGSSAITITGNLSSGSGWNTGSITSFTVTANTAVITFTATAVGMSFGSLNLNGGSIVVTGNSSPNTLITGLTCANFSYIPSSPLAGSLLTLSGNITCTSTFASTGGAAPHRIFIESGTTGTPRTITAAVVSMGVGVDLQDIKGAGTASWNLSGGDTGDCGGNSGITFPAAQTNYYHDVASDLFSNASNWYLGTGGTGGTGRVPLPQDTGIFDSNSGNFSYTMDTIRIGGMTMTGWAGTLLGTTTVTVYGSFIGSPLANTANMTGTGFVLSGRGNFQYLAGVGAGGQLSGLSWLGLAVVAFGGTYTLLDNVVTAPSRAVTLSAGTLDAATNNVNVTAHQIELSGTAVRVLNMGSGIWTLVGVGHVLDITAANLTINAGTSTIVVADTTTTGKVFANAAGFTFGTLNTTGCTSLVISAQATFAAIIAGPSDSLGLPVAGITVQSAAGVQLNGANLGYVFLPGVTGNYISSPDSSVLDITGDIDIRVKVGLFNWTPAAQAGLVSKASTNNYSYILLINTNGTIELATSNTGTAATTSATSTVATGFPNGTLRWIRATRVQATGVATFYTSTDGVTWTQLGSTVTSGVGQAIFSGSSDVEIGAFFGGADTIAGNFYRAQIYNGVNGTLVFDADLTQKPFLANSFTENANGATVTINGLFAQQGDGRCTLISNSAGTQAPLTVASGTVTASFISIQDSAAQGGATFQANAGNSILVSNDTGWTSAAYASPANVVVSGGPGFPQLSAKPTASNVTVSANHPSQSNATHAGLASVVVAAQHVLTDDTDYPTQAQVLVSAHNPTVTIESPGRVRVYAHATTTVLVDVKY